MMQRRAFDVRVVRLTPELARHVAEAAREAYVGDGTCSLLNMRRSCFACEMCASGISTPRHDPLALCQMESYVALTDADPQGRVLPFGEPLRYVGCVSVRTLPGDIVLPAGYDPGPFICNLCVAPDYRQSGAGTKLIERVLREKRGQSVYLTVYHDEGARPDVHDVFAVREPKLISYYNSLGFARCPCTETPHCVMVRRAP